MSFRTQVIFCVVILKLSGEKFPPGLVEVGYDLPVMWLSGDQQEPVHNH